MITLHFEGFSGSAAELYLAVRSGRIDALQLPIVQLAQQALAQVEALELQSRSELLPLLADLLLYKLRAALRKPEPPNEAEEDADPQGFVETLAALEEAIVFLQERAKERAKVLAVPPPPLPKDQRLRRLSAQVLWRAVQPFSRRADVLLEPERFGLREAWERLRGFLWNLGRGWFNRLPLVGWAEQTVGFAALLEAVKTGQVELYQERPFAEIEVEYRHKD